MIISVRERVGLSILALKQGNKLGSFIFLKL